MPRTVSGLYEQIVSYDNLYAAYLAARKGKRYRHLRTGPIGFKSVVMKTEVPQCQCKACGKAFEVSPPLPVHMCDTHDG